MANFNTTTITDEKLLFGRRGEIDLMWRVANMQSHFALVGTRRFGKTCLFKCMLNKLKAEDSPCIPIYLDFKEVSSVVRGTTNVYNYIVSMMTVEAYNYSLFTGKSTFLNGKLELAASKNWNDVYSQIEGIDSASSLQLLTEAVNTYSGLAGKPILLLIDEYEFMLKYAFTDTSGFFKLRTLGDDTQYNHPMLMLWVAGAESWSRMGVLLGSNELNTCGDPNYLYPLTKEDFLEMWDSESSTWHDEIDKKILSENRELAYEKSGGVPYYGKLIGKYILTHRSFPTFEILQAYFEEIFNSKITLQHKKLLIKLSTVARKLESSVELTDLMQQGLVKFENNKHEITIGFLVDYLKSLNQNVIQQKPISYGLVEEICRLLEAVNRTSYKKNKRKIFRDIESQLSIMLDMQSVVIDSRTFTCFVLATYKMYLERTEGKIICRDGFERSIAGANLPEDFNRRKDWRNPQKGLFARALARLRNDLIHVSDSNEESEQDSLEDTESMRLFFIGNNSEPVSKKEFQDFQTAVLTKFRDELIKMKIFLDKN